MSCSGATGDECVYSCDAGHAKGGSHICGTDGVFAGGGCTATSCSTGSTIANSPTLSCAGTTGTRCVYTCNAGYTKGGSHVCGTDGAWSGGSCTANSCTTGLTIGNSPVSCSGATGGECAYSCNVGYTKGGSHVCGTDGVFAGGGCPATSCSMGLTITDSQVSCSGDTGEECVYSCNAGYSKGESHVCGTDGRLPRGVHRKRVQCGVDY